MGTDSHMRSPSHALVVFLAAAACLCAADCTREAQKKATPVKTAAAAKPLIRKAAKPLILAAASANCNSNNANAVMRNALLIPPDDNNWCWAASAQMAMDFLEPNVDHSQCLQANESLGRQDCCHMPRPEGCAQGGGGIPPLQGFSSVSSQGPLDVDDVATELCVENRPFLMVGAGVAGGRHMTIAVGYDSAANVLVVNNPWKSNRVDQTYVALDDYQFSYHKIKKGPQP